MYISGEWAIERDAYGIDHGLSWGLWRGQTLVSTHSTLRSAKAAAAAQGQSGDWTRGSKAVEVPHAGH